MAPSTSAGCVWRSTPHARGRKLSDEQVRFLEKQNPQWRERHVESSLPGELVSQDTFYVGRFKGVGKVYLHAVVDTYSSHAFGSLHTSKQPEAAVVVLHNEVLPFYRAHEISRSALLTDNGTEFCGTAGHPYELYLCLCEIEHRRTKVRRPQTNGFVERFNRTVQEEFFEVAMVKTFYTSVDQLQADLDQWLSYYNRERTHQGYRNQGRRSYDTIQRYLKSRTKSVESFLRVQIKDVFRLLRRCQCRLSGLIAIGSIGLEISRMGSPQSMGMSNETSHGAHLSLVL